jgi:amino acid adenylation domain-containing protein
VIDAAMTTCYYTDAAQIFRDVVRRSAGRPALIWDAGVATTYEELDRLSNQVARLLLAHGVRKRDPVCLCLEKSALAYGSIVACLKLGAPYFVVDSANPRARIRTMVQRCGPKVALVDASVGPAAFDCRAVEIGAGDGRSVLAHLSDDEVTPGWSIDGSDPAYIMFTSGSTGSPKGVTISQANLLAFIAWTRHQFGTTPADVFTGVNPLFFDNSVFDTYASLFAGAALAPFGAATMRDPKAIVSRIETLGCTVYFSVPSLLVYLQTMKLVTAGSFPSLTTILFGGEGYPKPMLARLLDAVGDRIVLYNVYGPTECTCICSVYRVTAADLVEPAGYAPLGRLIPNFSGVILDESGRPAAPGDVGELYLGGPCVGLGYYNDAAQTAAAFVQNPTHDRFVDRVYRTGDLVRLDPLDGKIHFVGRADSQIKHQGYRIELAEIEHALVAVEGVDEAAAVYVANRATPRIVGVVASSRPLVPAAVRVAVQETLPRYMIPEQIVVVDRLSKNANGKIDRRAILASLERAEV